MEIRCIFILKEFITIVRFLLMVNGLENVPMGMSLSCMS